MRAISVPEQDWKKPIVNLLLLTFVSTQYIASPMKVLFDHPSPFLLAHGGFQIQIERTKAGLEAAAVEVEYLRWWDAEQKGDILHYFGRPPLWQIEFAQQKGMKMIFTQLLTGAGSRSPSALRAEKMSIGLARRFLPGLVTQQFAWDAFQMANGCVALTPWEAHLMSYLFGAPRERVHVVTNGVEDAFLNSPTAIRGPWLICTATITERKRVLELAETAVLAKTPTWIIGKPYSESDPYAKKLSRLVRDQPGLVRYDGAVNDREKLAGIYRQARGFVLLSTMESLSLSALEAAACECPLLLSDLPWARTVFGQDASYCPITSSANAAPFLRNFYDAAPGMRLPPKPATWIEVTKQLKKIYESLFRTSR